MKIAYQINFDKQTNLSSEKSAKEKKKSNIKKYN